MDQDATSDVRLAAGVTEFVVAHSRVTMREETARLIRSNEMKKGDVLGAAQYAALQAAKSAPAYLPLLAAGTTLAPRVVFEVGDDYVDVHVEMTGRGPECTMPALSAATAAALTIFDMCKGVDRTMAISRVAVDPAVDPAIDDAQGS